MDRVIQRIGYYFRNNSAQRSTLGLMVTTGVLGSIYLLLYSSSIGIDFAIFYYSAINGFAGDPFILTRPVDWGGGPYIFPPISIVYFYLYSFVEFNTAFLIHTLINAILSLGIGTLTIRFLTMNGIEIDRIDLVLLYAVFFVSVPILTSFSLGQVNHHILLALTVMFLGLEQNDELTSGVSLGLATAFKGWPALTGLYLIRERAIKTIVFSVATAGTLTIMGAFLFGIDTTIQYFIAVTEFRKAAFVGGLSPNSPLVTLRRPISMIFPYINPDWYTIIAVACVLPFLGYVYFVSSTDQITHRLATFLGTIVAVIFVIQSTNYYVVFTYFPLVSLLYLSEDHLALLLYCLGGVLIQFLVTPAMIASILNGLPLSSGTIQILLELVIGAFSIVSIPLVGLLCLFLGCIFEVTNR